MHLQAVELLATFSIVKIYLWAASLRNFPKFAITFSGIAYLLKLRSSFKSLGFPRSLVLAAHQSVSIFNVLSFFIFYLGPGSIRRQSPCKVNLTAWGGCAIDFNSVKLFLSNIKRACSAALRWGKTAASYF